MLATVLTVMRKCGMWQREIGFIDAWVNEAETLRTYGGKRDAYAVFKAMLDKGDRPDSWSELVKAVGAGTNQDKDGKKQRR